MRECAHLGRVGNLHITSQKDPAAYSIFTKAHLLESVSLDYRTLRVKQSVIKYLRSKYYEKPKVRTICAP